MEACRNWQTRLNAWYDGEVSELDAGEVRAHLMDCAGCRAAVSRWKNLAGDLALLQPEGPSEEALDRMAYQFEQGLAGEVRGFSRALRVWNLAAAALLLVAVVSFTADRFLLPSTAQAGSQRDIERDLRDLRELIDRTPYPAVDSFSESLEREKDEEQDRD